MLGWTMYNQPFLLPRAVRLNGIKGKIILPDTSDGQESFLNRLVNAVNTLDHSVVQRIIRDEITKIQNGKIHEKHGI